MQKSKNEYEIINYPQIKYVNIFIVNLIYRTLHLHKDMEFCLILEGSVKITTKAQEFVAQQGSIIFFNSNQPHEIHSENNSAKIISLQISPSFCKDYFPLLQNFTFECTHLNEVVPKQNLEELFLFCLNTTLTYFNKDLGHELKCMSDLNYLYSKMLNIVPYHIIQNDEYLLIKKKISRLNRIVNYIEEHYTEKLSLADIAENEGLSITYLSHFFSDNLNITFQEYVNNLRFEKAVQLLQQTDLRLIDVCLESGFSDGKYLNKIFLRNYGYTPKEYRKKAQKALSTNKVDSNLLASQYIYTASESLSILKEYLIPNKIDDSSHSFYQTLF